jgi:hypothetical protein
MTYTYDREREKEREREREIDEFTLRVFIIFVSFFFAENKVKSASCKEPKKNLFQSQF